MYWEEIVQDSNLLVCALGPLVVRERITLHSPALLCTLGIGFWLTINTFRLDQHLMAQAGIQFGSLLLGLLFGSLLC